MTERFRSERLDPGSHDPRNIVRRGPSEIPAVLLARLALAQKLRRQGLGRLLVADALQRVVSASQIVGARLDAVDAITESVIQPYETLGFRRIAASLLLVHKISDIETSFGP